MPASILEIKDRLVRIIDEDGSVQDMAAASDAIQILERMTVTKEELESTRLGLYVNNIRRASKNSPLAKRAKNLIISWKKLINTPARIVQQTRPETPNSVGSSPSPPEPPDDGGIIRNYSSPQLPSWPKSRSGTPTSDPGVKKSRKHKTTPESGKTSRKRDVSDSPMVNKGQSSDVKSEKQALDTGQPTMSVGSNGLKLTFKTQSTMQATANQIKDSVNRSKMPALLKRSTTDSNLCVPHKSHKKKKGHKSPHKTSSPALSSATERITTQQQDAYNNNSTEHKMQSSKSAPNLTVKKEITKGSTTKTQNTMRNSSPDKTNFNLKRKRDQTQIDTTSPERSSENKARAPKERRLTYDPLTGQLKQVPSQDKPISVLPETTKKTPEKTTAKHTSSTTEVAKGISHSTTIKNSSIPSSEEHLRSNKGKTFKSTAVKITPNAEKAIKVAEKLKTSEIDMCEVREISCEDLPTRLSPTVEIMSDLSISWRKKCSDNCSRSNLYKTHREFRKRKTRRKDASFLDLKTLFPISNAVDTISSDSDENSDPENSFAASVNVEDSLEPTHSPNCVWPGVTGCRGNNGAWYDWKETFCVRNHEDSERLPQEEEILPLQILPYVELD